MRHSRIAIVVLLLPLTGACRGLGTAPEPPPSPPMPGVERTVGERMDEASGIFNRMNRLQARADRLEPFTLTQTRLTDFGMMRREEGVRLMMRDVGRAAEGTAWAADRMRELLRDPGMTGDPEMRARLERMSEHLVLVADRLEESLEDLERMRARLR